MPMSPVRSLVQAPAPPSPDLMARINTRSQDGESRAELELFAALRDLLRTRAAGQRLLVVCVGTPLNAGDSLGPMTGTFLERSLQPFRQRLNVEVVGTLDHPVHATNLAEKGSDFERENTFVLAVDASVGTPGEIQLKWGPLEPGAAMGRELPKVGHAQLLCGIAPVMMGFWCAHMGMVLNMAEMCSRSILRAAISVQQAAS